jgi:predicted ABC-type transport system involved in lysophospholipase L1 biosynthesis ATPase subunit
MNGALIVDLFERIRREYGMTVIVVTHDYSIAKRADRQIDLKDGLIV